MGARGPKPTPSAIKQRRGTFRADRAAMNEATPTGRPTCPTWLSLDAKREWRRIVPELEAMGLIGRVDRNAIARYCELWVRWRRVEAILAKTGDVLPIKNDDGSLKYLQQSPYVSIARTLAEQLLKLETSFGMSPSARSRIEVAPTKPQQQLSKSRFFPTGPALKTG